MTETALTDETLPDFQEFTIAEIRRVYDILRSDYVDAEKVSLARMKLAFFLDWARRHDARSRRP